MITHKNSNQLGKLLQLFETLKTEYVLVCTGNCEITKFIRL